MTRVEDVREARGELEWDTPLYRMAVAQLEQALPYADIDSTVAERLRFPERALMVSVPIRLDSDERRVFPGYRVQHSSALGPSKVIAIGALRMTASNSLSI